MGQKNAAAQAVNLREGDEDYARVILRVGPRHRIVECRDRIQWIIQRRVSSERATKAQWRGIKHHRSRVALIASLVEMQLALSPKDRAQLAQLPEWLS